MNRDAIAGWISARRSAITTAVSGVLVAAVVATVAVVSGGYEAQRLDLDDGSVWVANGSQNVVGRANTQILSLDTVIPTSGTDLQLVQDGRDVLVVDRTDNKIDIVDPASAEAPESVPLPPQDPQVFLAQGTVVILAAGTGEIWFTPVEELADFDAESEPLRTFGADAVASVSEEGIVHVYSPDAAEVYRIDVDDPDQVVVSPARLGERDDVVQITSVAGRWVLLDTDTAELSIEGRIVDLSTRIPDAAGAVLQRPAASDDSILVAFPGGLVATTVAGEEPELLSDREASASASPVMVTAARPVVAGACVFAGWSDGTAWRRCGTAAAELSLQGMAPVARGLSFDVNGTSIVLNDPASGGTWAVQGDGAAISNWAELIEEQQDEDTVQQNDVDTEPELQEDQVLPVAVEDALGARPSRSTVLPVLLNDYDQNGDVLSIDSVDQLDDGIGRLDVVNDRQQLQLTLPADASGSLSFNYTISDGRGGTASARVIVAVRAAGENGAPAQIRQSRLGVEATRTGTASVLGDWVDPDGDAFYLAQASAGDGGDTGDAVSFKPDGTVVFRDGQGTAGTRSVALVVSDGSADGSGSLTVTVAAAGGVPLAADAFAITAYAGREITISPLSHVRGGGGTYRLSSVPAKPGSTVDASLEAGTFRFRSDQVRAHLLDYVVTDGDATTTGRVRVDVLAPPDASTAPITTPKTVFVRTGATETLDIAASDSDPAGGVLILSSVDELPPVSGVGLELIEQRAVRITLTGPLDTGSLTFGYLVTNGLADAAGSVTVIEIPPPSRYQPPVATDDAVTARVGAAIDIPALVNDEQPDGYPITLDPGLVSVPPSANGLAFARGDIVRYLAPDRTGTFTIDYLVRGPGGQSDQGRITVSVREAVESTNAAPVPATITARVIAGKTVRVPVPLSGIDPDGDAVQLLGQETNPQKGAVTDVGQDFLLYEAGPYSAGTDTFTYTVIDGLGTRASGTVRIGITPPSDIGRNPVAVPDEVRVRPGKTVSIQVLANDSDPDGGELTVTEVEPITGDVTAEVLASGVIDVTPPAAVGTYTVLYTIKNGAGGQAQAYAVINVDETARPSRPDASDTVLTLSDILDRDTIDVDVLQNVFFADGTSRSLDLALVPGYSDTAVVTAGKRIRVTVAEERQIIPFSVANPDDATAVGYAFVWVPGLADTLPQLDRTRRGPTVESESALTIDLNDYVLAVGGRQVRLTDQTSVQATHANGEPLVLDAQTLRFTSADAYFGPASISFTVTDGASADDPNGRVATLVLPITVTPLQNQPPVFTGQTVEFEPGQLRNIDLRELTTYPDSADASQLLYQAPSVRPEGFDFRLTGSMLAITAREDAVIGSSSILAIGVSDAASQGQSGRIRLDIVPSTRPLARPAADTVVAQRGRTTIVDVLANDEATNPFPGRPLTVVAIRGLDGGSVPAGVSVIPSVDNSRLSITVAAGAEPVDTNLQYQVSDATGDPSRFVYGSVRISVQDRPDTPAAPVRADGGYEEGQITLRLAASQSNNSPILRYEVVGQGGYRHDCGLELRCSLNDLTPGVRYQFQVVATNGVGSSDVSPSSVDFAADYLPAAPASVTARATAANPSGSLAVEWTPVPNPSPGTSITRYVVRVTGPGVDLRTSVSAGTTSVSGDAGGQLSPNTSYVVTVYAQNSALVLSDADWRRTSSAPVTTVGTPGQVGALTAASIDASGRVQVTWGAADPNGAGSVSYRILRLDEGGGAPACADGVGAAASSGYSDGGVGDGQRVRYAVYADNGFFCSVTVSGVVESRRAPGSASGTTEVVQNGDTGQYDIRARAFGVSQGTAVRYEVNVNGTAWRRVAENDLLTSRASAGVYGNPQSVVYRGCRDETENLCGEASSPDVRTPVDTRAGVASCIAGQLPQPIAPTNANATVRYFYDYAGNGFDYDGFVEDDSAPATTDPFTVRVRAEVTVGGQAPLTDPLFGTADCQGQ